MFLFSLAVLTNNFFIYFYSTYFKFHLKQKMKPDNKIVKKE